MQDRKPDTKYPGTIAVQTALDEFAKLGRSAFLKEYGFGKSRQYLVRDPRTGALCNSKAIVGVAHRFEYPNEGPLKAEQFSGGEANVATKLRALGFEVVRIGEDWTTEDPRHGHSVLRYASTRSTAAKVQQVRTQTRFCGGYLTGLRP